MNVTSLWCDPFQDFSNLLKKAQFEQGFDLWTLIEKIGKPQDFQFPKWEFNMGILRRNY
jgi:hypothetical protein